MLALIPTEIKFIIPNLFVNLPTIGEKIKNTIANGARIKNDIIELPPNPKGSGERIKMGID